MKKKEEKTSVAGCLLLLFAYAFCFWCMPLLAAAQHTGVSKVEAICIAHFIGGVILLVVGELGKIYRINRYFKAKKKNDKRKKRKN